MQDIKFLVPTTPVPKARKVTTKTGITFMPKKTVVFENLVKTVFMNKYPDFTPTDELVVLYTEFRFPIPQSAKRKKGPDKILPGDPFPSRPDLDNLEKSVMDGLNGVAYLDDRYIVEKHSRKVYGEVPGAFISLRPATGGKGNV